MQPGLIQSRESPARRIWQDALRVAAVFASAPADLGGICVRSPAGPVRDAWLAALRARFPTATPIRRVPVQVSESRLLGGLDLTATLATGKPVAERGLLSECDGGIAIVVSAERMPAGTAAQFSAALDSGVVVVERDGIALRLPARFGIVLLDEGIDDLEMPPASLVDRCTFLLDLSTLCTRDIADAPEGMAPMNAAIGSGNRADTHGSSVTVQESDEAIATLTYAAHELGVTGLRAPLLALKAARRHAAFIGRTCIGDDDVFFAARAVLAPRATTLPTAEAADAGEPESAADTEQSPPAEDVRPSRLDEPSSDASPQPAKESETTEAADPAADDSAAAPMQQMVLAAAQAAIPDGLLQQLIRHGASGRARSAGRAGQLRHGAKRGRPVGVKAGHPRSGARINILATLRAAAPWQLIRRREAGAGRQTAVHIRSGDFRINRYLQRAETTTIFVVDASGSSALHRLAEAKGAVELLLADCYVRRDRVAVIAFHGQVAETLLPPTRSLARAKRSLAGLPGGGGTPLATGIDAARGMAAASARRGETPVIVLLTDGRANVDRSGLGGRVSAATDALSAARSICGDNVAAILIDTSNSKQPQAESLAGAMRAIYLPLPRADSAVLSRAVLGAAKALQTHG